MKANTDFEYCVDDYMRQHVVRELQQKVIQTTACSNNHNNNCNNNSNNQPAYSMATMMMNTMSKDDQKGATGLQQTAIEYNDDHANTNNLIAHQSDFTTNPWSTIDAVVQEQEKGPITAVLSAYYASINRNNLEDTMTLWLPSDNIECMLPGYKKAVRTSLIDLLMD